MSESTISKRDRARLSDAIFTIRQLGYDTKEWIYQNRQSRSNYQLKRREQFIVVAFLSIQEIRNADHVHFMNYIRELDFKKEEITSNVFINGRILTVLNEHVYPYRHGEEIAFGCLGDYSPYILKTDLLGQLQLNYLSEGFSMNDCVVLMYSHFIPCTDSGHNCSFILNQFVGRTGLKMALAYKEVFPTTVEYVAISNITNRGIDILQHERFKMNYESGYFPPSPVSRAPIPDFQFPFWACPMEIRYNGDYEQVYRQQRMHNNSYRPTPFDRRICAYDYWREQY